MLKLSLLIVSLTMGATAVWKSQANTQARAGESVREEFHQTYPLTEGGRVSIQNIVGAIRVTTWERNEVRVDAVKTAPTRRILDEATIKVEAGPSSVNIVTRYPDASNNEPAVVEYNITVPRSVAALAAHVHIAGLYIDGVGGDVTASSINGEVIARGLAGEAKLSSVNGRLEASFERLNKGKPVSLTTVNRDIVLTLPPDAAAEVWANSQYSQITNDFGLTVRRGDFRGSALSGTIGGGGTRITLNNDRGGITIRRAPARNP